MKYTIGLFFIFLLATQVHGQSSVLLKGKVQNDNTEAFMPSVHVLNLNSVEGVITNEKGQFEIAAQVNDTLYFSYLGFKPLKVAVSNDMIKFGPPVFRLTSLSFALEEVIVRPYELTGYLDIDVRKVPLNPAGGTAYLDCHSRAMKRETATVPLFQKRLVPCSILRIFSTISLAKTPNRCVSLKRCARTMRLEIC